MVIGFESTSLIIDGLWEVFLDDEVLFSKIENYSFLKYTLSILSKLLEDSKNVNVYDHMLKKGIGSQILKFIDRYRKANILIDVHEDLLLLINHYLACQIAYPPINPDKIGDITLQTPSVNEK